MTDTMRDRLERLKNSSSQGNFESRARDEKPREEKLLTPETIFMKKADKIISTIEGLRTKMHSGTDQYISLYQELKKAEEDFLALLQDPEVKMMDFPTAFVSKVDNTNKKLLTKKV